MWRRIWRRRSRRGRGRRGGGVDQLARGGVEAELLLVVEVGVGGEADLVGGYLVRKWRRRRGGKEEEEEMRRRGEGVVLNKPRNWSDPRQMA